MTTIPQLLAEIGALPLSDTVRVLNLSASHERVIALSGLRRVLPEPVRLLSGPGCAASICPQADIYQALALVQRQAVTLLVSDGLLRLPLGQAVSGRHSLLEAQRAGADVRSVTSPAEAMLIAQQEPTRPMVLFVAGFETLLAPLAGMVLAGLPDNLSILLCGRRVEPVLEQRLFTELAVHALLLPGNRCAVTGIAGWERISATHEIPAAVTGYTPLGLLQALHAVLAQHCNGEARVDNCYRALVRPDGRLQAREQVDRVFELAGGRWRGLGVVESSAYRLRDAFAHLDADRCHPDYRGELDTRIAEMPQGCDCAEVVTGHKLPADCRHFAHSCRTHSPYGPCMAVDDGTCHLHDGIGLVA